MTNAAEIFALQLSRASLRANRFLRARNLSREDRNDVVAAAMLWCWENRDNYSLTVTLELWFLGAVRDAYKAWMRGEMREATEIVEDMGAPDDTSVRAQALQAIEKIQRRVAEMPEIEQRIAALIMRQWTQDEIRTELKIDINLIPEVRRKLAPFAKLIPDTPDTRWMIRKAVSRDSDEASGELSGIDKEIASLDFPPPAGKECPPCWRCKWFEGYMPGSNKVVRMEIVERNVKAAVLKTERRKKHIAKEVRDGNL
jgi:DNA-directed RNA polymerase specialized sigma24 family protein